MKGIVRYQSKTDLKYLRIIYKLSKEEIADNIGYTVRSLERMEKENAVTGEETARRLCELFKINFEEQFYVIDQRNQKKLNDVLASRETVPKNLIYDDCEYYYLYVRRLSLFKDCIAGKGFWIADYNKNKEIRRLRKVDAEKALLIEPDITIINQESEWRYWYFKLCIGKIYTVIVSETCMKVCLKTCLEDVIVKKSELMCYKRTTDIMFLGYNNRVKNRE